MGINISKLNIKNYKGEKIADLIIKSSNKIKPINCPRKFNSLAIDEFLLIFLVAAKANGVSYFKNLSELNQKKVQGSNGVQKSLIKLVLKMLLLKIVLKFLATLTYKLIKKS